MPLVRCGKAALKGPSILYQQPSRTELVECEAIIWARRAHNKTVVASQGASTDSRFLGEKLWLELSEGDENWHEC